MSVDFDDRAREILNTAVATSETGNQPPTGACPPPGNPSHVFQELNCQKYNLSCNDALLQ